MNLKPTDVVFNPRTGEDETCFNHIDLEEVFTDHHVSPSSDDVLVIGVCRCEGIVADESPQSRKLRPEPLCCPMCIQLKLEAMVSQ
jgi:hypothetical protein